MGIANGLHVEGKGLKVYGVNDPNPSKPGIQPLFEIEGFHFQTALRNLFREPMNVDTIYVQGLTINIPPKNERKEMTGLKRQGLKTKITVDEFECVGTKLLINTSRPGKMPLEFDISNLRLVDIGPDLPFQFDATLVNPKPVGDIHSVGRFGPFNEWSPRDSAVNGDYSFTNADLGTIRGIGGILSSTGHYTGSLGRIEVDGTTDTPDFRIAISGRAVPLHTDFHAIVDGTDGDTYLEPVSARLLNSSFTAKGKVEHIQNAHGHDIELDVTMGRANIEDLLRLGVKTEPPVITGPVKMNTKLSLKPGDADVIDRLKLTGGFQLPSTHFTNEKVQDRIDSLSLRGQGHPQLIGKGPDINVPTNLEGSFQLNQGILSFSSLQFKIPGTHADITGQYSLDGNTFDFHGLLKTDAKLSQMTTGWKSILLKPVDPFFHKHGAGAEIPFKISGTRDEPHFGLDLGHNEDSPTAQREPANRR